VPGEIFDDALWRAAVPGGPGRGGPRPSTAACVIIGVIAALIIPFVAAPDVSTDALEYHLLVPKTILAKNAITYLPHVVESNYPSLGEYDFMPLLAVGNDRAAKAFHFLCAILVLFALGGAPFLALMGISLEAFRIFGGLLLFLLIGFAISTVLIAREQLNTERALKAEQEQRALADANFQQARQMLDFFTQVSVAELADKPAVQEARRKLLEAALTYYRSFLDQHGDDPSIREALVASQLRVADILHDMGDPTQALAAMERARQLQEEQVHEHPRNPEYRDRLLFINHNLRWLRDSRFQLLMEPSVQQELKLSPEQKQRSNQVAEKLRDIIRNPNSLSTEEIRARLEKLADQEKALLNELGPEQAQRLKQIAWQQAGRAGLGGAVRRPAPPGDPSAQPAARRGVHHPGVRRCGGRHRSGGRRGGGAAADAISTGATWSRLRVRRGHVQAHTVIVPRSPLFPRRVPSPYTARATG